MRAPFARLALLTSAMTLFAGCVDTPPDYSEPIRVPPVIITGEVVPPSTSLFVSEGPTAIDFTVPFRADDVGGRLQSLIVLDIDLGTPQPKSRADVPSDPRTFADQNPPRTLKYRFNWTMQDLGCHTLTAILSDSSNINGFYDTDSALLEARVTWFLWLRDASAPSSDTVDCFQSGTKP